MNLIDRRVEVHTEPYAGKYRRVIAHDRDSNIRLVVFPELQLRVADFVR